MKKIIIYLSLLMSANLYAVSSGTYTVNTAGGGDFTGLIAAEAGLQGSLMSPVTIQCCGVDYLGQNILNLSGWSTYPTAYLLITGAEGCRTKGVWNENYFTVKSSYGLSGNGVILISIENVRIDGLQVEQSTNSTVATCRGITISGADVFVRDIRISNCVMRWTPTELYSNSFTQGAAIDWDSINSTITLRMWNNVFFNWPRGYIYNSTKNLDDTIIAYNNTYYETCMASGGVSSLFGNFNLSQGTHTVKMVLKNNLMFSTTRCFYINPTGYANFISSSNISNDNTSPDVEYRERSVNFADATNRFLLPLITDTTAYQQGVNLNPDPDGYIDVVFDITGQTRPTLPTVGAFEIQMNPIYRKKNIYTIYKD